MRKYAVIVAGGSGTRMGGGIPKQFRNLCGRPVLWWSMKAFHDEDPDTRLILVLPEEFISLWEDFYDALPEEEKFAYKSIAGGDSRTESVKKGLSLIEDDESLVAIHDGARPLVTKKMISDGWDYGVQYGNGVPVVPVTDSLREWVDNVTTKNVDRKYYSIVQTPQVFKTSIIKEAYKKSGKETFTDDATVVENAGNLIHLYEGTPDNIKITNPKDMAIAAILLGRNA